MWELNKQLVCKLTIGVIGDFQPLQLHTRSCGGGVVRSGCSSCTTVRCSSGSCAVGRRCKASTESEIGLVGVGRLAALVLPSQLTRHMPQESKHRHSRVLVPAAAAAFDAAAAAAPSVVAALAALSAAVAAAAEPVWVYDNQVRAKQSTSKSGAVGS